MRNRRSNGLPILYGEGLGHSRECGCGCWLTPEQWLNEYANDLACPDLINGQYRTESEVNYDMALDT